jgi:hypothetical protein
MKLEQLTLLLQKQAGARKDGAAFLLPAETDVGFFVGLEGETLAIPRVTKLEIVDDAIVCETQKDEKFVVLLEDVLGFKVEKAEGRRQHGAGFGNR